MTQEVAPNKSQSPLHDQAKSAGYDVHWVSTPMLPSFKRGRRYTVDSARLLTRHQLARRRARRRGHHGIDVACAVLAVLLPVLGVNLIVEFRTARGGVVLVEGV
jgi:hypothetical protein